MQSDQRKRWKLTGQPKQAMAIADAIARAPVGYIVEIRPETRSDAQNRLLWPLLTDISNQVTHYGRKLAPAEWKVGLTLGLSHTEFVPGIFPDTIWPLDLNTSTMSTERFSGLIELTYAYGAEKGVRFRTDKPRDD